MNQLSAPSAYDYGLLLYFERDDYDKALNYLIISAEDDYVPAYGDIRIIYHREKNDMVNALKWFQKAEDVNFLYPPAS